MMPREPRTSDIQTSTLTCWGVALASGLLMWVHSMQFQTGRSSPAHFRRRVTPSATNHNLPATSRCSWQAGEMSNEENVQPSPVAGGIDVERSDVAALHVLGVILRMIASHAAADILIPGHALTEIQEDGAR